jgi:CheY-like chemotaxis protein
MREMNATAEVHRDSQRDRPLVLIVEDQADLRQLYVEHLSMSGFDVLQAGNGADAIQTEATRRLKADAQTGHIPIVALTAHDGAGELKRATDAGCDWFVPKPCPPDALITELRRVLSPHGAGVRGGKPEPARPTSA